MKDSAGGPLDGMPTTRPSGLEKILSQGKDKLGIASFTRRRSSAQTPGRNRLLTTVTDAGCAWGADSAQTSPPSRPLVRVTAHQSNPSMLLGESDRSITLFRKLLRVSRTPQKAPPAGICPGPSQAIATHPFRFRFRTSPNQLPGPTATVADGQVTPLSLAGFVCGL